MASKKSIIITTIVSLLSLVIVIGLFLFYSSVRGHNMANEYESLIMADRKEVLSLISGYSNKIREMAQVSNKYAADFEKIYRSALEGRYGPDGSKAAFQWLQEKNPELDSSMYTGIHRAMEAGRDKIDNAQKKLIDDRRGYITAQGTYWTGMWIAKAGYPKINLDEYDIIISNYAKTAGETGIDDGITVFQ